MTALGRGGRTAAISAVCFLILAVAFFARTTGIHIDESNYLKLALVAPYGDSASTGKPFLFYLSNYFFMHSIGFAFGPLRPISLHLAYIGFFLVSLAWAVPAAARNQSSSESLARAIVLLASPLVLLNATSLMMESAALPLLTFTLGCILRDSPDDPDSAPRLLLAVASALATAVKSTTIPALLLLALAFRGRLKSRAHFIPIGIAAGLALNYLGLRGIGPNGNFVYGGPAEVFSTTVLMDRSLSRAGSYVGTWFFFAGIGFAIAAALRPSEALKNREFLILTLGSLAGVFLFQLVSVFQFARYCYPVMWAALLGVWLLIELENRALVGLLIALQLVQAVPLFTHSIDRFRLWPPLVTGELVESGGTIFTGFPIYGMTAWQLVRDNRPCVWINSEHGEKNEVLDQFVRSTFPGATILRSSIFEIARDRSCSLSNTVRFWREHVDGPDAPCITGCRRCEFQRVDYFAVMRGWVRNQTCWPRR